MSADRQLATEIEFDLRKFEEEQEAAQQQPLPPPRQTPQRTPQRTPRPGRPSARNSPKVVYLTFVMLNLFLGIIQIYLHFQ